MNHLRQNTIRTVKKGLLTNFLLFIFFASYGATTFTLPNSTYSSTSGTPIQFLTTTTGTSDNGAPYSIIIPAGVLFTIDDANFNLATLAGDVTLTVQGGAPYPTGGQIYFNKNNGSLTINTGDELVVNPGNSNGLDASQGNQIKIFTDGTNFNRNDLNTIIAQGGVRGNGQPLPVELLFFKAKLSGTAVKIEWATSSESLNERFEIEHSTTGRYFQKIGEIAGAGTSHDLVEYSFVFDNPVAGENYFRLRQVDFDGIYTLSRIEAVKINEEKQLNFSLRWAGDHLELYFTEEVGPFQASVFNLHGQPISRQTLAGVSTLAFDMSKVPTGLYLLLIDQGGFHQTVKILRP